MREPKFKVGDKVKVLRASTKAEHDLWMDSWASEMNGAIGKEGIIVHCNNNEYWGLGKCCPKYMLEINGMSCGYSFPEFVLQNEIQVGQQLLLEFMVEFMK